MEWHELIAQEQEKPYLQSLLQQIAEERQAGQTIYPAEPDLFNALTWTPFNDVKVVILGQDPYHGAGQAHGLAFSVQKSVPIPPSLRNIYKELERSVVGFTPPNHGDLTAWAKQGVLLLNTVLTVEAGKAHSHANRGWEQFTDRMIQALDQQRSGVIFLLWGSHAQKKSTLIDPQKQFILTSSHPSPLSAYRGFLGCDHFNQVNHRLIEQGKTPIDWSL